VSRRLALLLLLVVAPGCLLPPRERVEPLRISQRVGQGDASRRASLRLVLDGLDAEVARDAPRARSLYQRALQVDPTNPYAFLALARQAAEKGHIPLGLTYLQQAAAWLAEDPAREAARVHLEGLRGALLRQQGAPEGLALLRHAAELAPGVWGDGRLDARELR